MPWCVVVWVASSAGLPVHPSSLSSPWLRFLPSLPLGFLPRPRASLGRVFRCRDATPWCSLRVSRLTRPGSFPTGNRGSRGRIGTSGPSRIRPRLTSRRPVSRPTSARVSPLPVGSAFRFPTRLRPPTSAGSGRCCLRGRDAVGSVLPSCRSPFGAVPGIRSGFPPGGAVGHRDPTSTPVPDPGFAPPTRQVVAGSGPACDREARLFASLRPEPVIPRDPSCHVSVRPRGPPGK